MVKKRLHIEKELESLRKRVGGNVRKFRKMNGLTQATLSEMADLGTESRISDIESGRYSLADKTLIRLARALNIEIYQFYKCETDDVPVINKAIIERQLLVLQKSVTSLMGISAEIDQGLGKFVKAVK